MFPHRLISTLSFSLLPTGASDAGILGTNQRSLSRASSAACNFDLTCSIWWVICRRFSISWERSLADALGTCVAFESLMNVKGVSAIVLGGSRAKGTHHSVSDFDLGLYYESDSPPDIRQLCQVVKNLDDRKQDHLLTSFGEWGPWINGGGWLKVKSM